MLYRSLQEHHHHETDEAYGSRGDSSSGFFLSIPSQQNAPLKIGDLWYQLSFFNIKLILNKFLS